MCGWSQLEIHSESAGSGATELWVGCDCLGQAIKKQTDTPTSHASLETHSVDLPETAHFQVYSIMSIGFTAVLKTGLWGHKVAALTLN